MTRDDMSSEPTSFEPGAPVAEGVIPLCVPHLVGNEWAYIRECLDTNYVSSVGPFVERFEHALAERTGTAHAVATVNGTAALHIALRVVGVERDDEVLVSALTFIAPAFAVRYLGAFPVFIDAEPQYWQMDPRLVAAFLHEQCERRDSVVYNRETGRRVRAIVPVHILGHPVDMDPLLDVAREFDLAVIEDATESLGARYKGKLASSIGDMGCLSFNGNKLITTGGGGAIVTNDEARAHRATYLTKQAKDDAVEFVHGELGYNYRLTNIAAALGCAQLEQLDDYIARKRAITARYNEAFAGVDGLTLPHEAPWAFSVNWLYTMLVDVDQYGTSSRELMRSLADRGIQTRPLWQPLHRSPSQRDAAPAHCPVAERLNAMALSLPSSVGLTADEQDRVIDTVITLSGKQRSALQSRHATETLSIRGL